MKPSAAEYRCRIHTQIVRRQLVRPFAIARGVRTHSELLNVQVTCDDVSGRGEAVGIHYNGETPASLEQQIRQNLEKLEVCKTREQLKRLLPAGGARAALDAALWDLGSRTTGTPIWQTAGLASPPQPVTTAFTISLDTPEAMGEQTAEEADRPLLKVKLGGGDGLDVERARQIRANAPHAQLIADGNCGFSEQTLDVTARGLADLGFTLFEQPLPVGGDDILEDYNAPLPLCADESFSTIDDLALVATRYQFANIKLDKCGGLTHGLELLAALKDRGIGTFVGTMLGGWLSITPALLLAQTADFVDLDGPLWMADDDGLSACISGSQLMPPPSGFWGI